MSKSLTNKKKSKTKKALDPKVLGRDLTPFEEYRLSLEQGTPSNQAALGEYLQKNIVDPSKEETKTNWKEAGLSGKMGVASNIIGGIGEIADATAANAKIKDTTEDRNNINQFGNATYNATSYEDSVAQFNSRGELKEYSKNDLTGSAGEKAKNVGKATLAGAKAGSQFGPLGAIIGGAVGLISSGIGAGVGNSKAKKEAERLNHMSMMADLRNTSNFDINTDNIAYQNNMMDMANYAAYGGLFNKFDGGGNTNSRITRQDYLQSKADEVRNKAIEYSYSREMPTAYYNDGYVQTYNAKTGLWEEVPGINYNDSCLYTYTDSYSQDGINRRVPGNQTLYADPLKYGFKPIEKSEVQKGDLVQATDSEGIPRHAMLYTGTNYLGNPIFNYSVGDVYGTYKKDNPYKVDDTDLYYTFVGTPEDQHRWTLEYIDEYMKSKLKTAGLEEGINEHLNKHHYNSEILDKINLEIPMVKEKKYGGIFDFGGPLFKEFSNGVTTINEGGTHEENIHGGVPVGVDDEGVPNLVEEDEVIWNNYVFSNRLKPMKSVKTKYKLGGPKDLTFADAAKDISKMSEEMPNDPIVRRTRDLRLGQLMQEQEVIRMQKNKTNNPVGFAAFGGNLFNNGGDKHTSEDIPIYLGRNARIPGYEFNDLEYNAMTQGYKQLEDIYRNYDEKMINSILEDAKMPDYGDPTKSTMSDEEYEQFTEKHINDLNFEKEPLPHWRNPGDAQYFDSETYQYKSPETQQHIRSILDDIYKKDGTAIHNFKKVLEPLIKEAEKTGNWTKVNQTINDSELFSPINKSIVGYNKDVAAYDGPSTRARVNTIMSYVNGDPLVPKGEKSTYKEDIKDIKLPEREILVTKPKETTSSPEGNDKPKLGLDKILNAANVGFDVVSGYLDRFLTKPDYSHYDSFRDAINRANVRVAADPVVSNLRYKPFDTQSIYNRMQANNAANVRNIMNTSGGNSAIARASLLTNDNNFNNSLGNLWRQVEEGEYARRMNYDKYMTDLAAGNSARKMQADSTNANIAANQAGLWKQYADARQNIDNITSAALSTNYNTAKQSLQGYAQQLWAENNIDNAIKNGYLIDNATGRRYNVSAETPAAPKPVEDGTRAYGGKIKRTNKKKRRLS